MNDIKQKNIDNLTRDQHLNQLVILKELKILDTDIEETLNLGIKDLNHFAIYTALILFQYITDNYSKSL